MVSIRWDDQRSVYACKVWLEPREGSGVNVEHVEVGPTPSRQREEAVDSKGSYDSAAQAAISFGSDRGNPDRDDQGSIIWKQRAPRRRRASRFERILS